MDEARWTGMMGGERCDWLEGGGLGARAGRDAGIDIEVDAEDE